MFIFGIFEIFKIFKKIVYKKVLKVRFSKKFKKLGLGVVGVRVRCREFIIMINSKCAANV